jgi:energy-coupling factor transporter ATP-binding protein EcfA2
MELCLKSIDKVLRYAFNQQDTSLMDDVTLTIGNTGSGKSTLLQYLIRSPSAMELRVLTETRIVRGRRLTQTLKVIDVIEKFRNVLFNIGHSNRKSETFMPNFHFDPIAKMTFADLAGQNDTRGELMEIINLLLIKRVFNIAKKVRMLVVIPIDDVCSARGTVVLKQLETVIQII